MSKELNIIDINLFSGSSEVFRTAIGGYWEILSSSAGEQIVPIELDEQDSSFPDEDITTPVDNHNPFISSVLSAHSLKETLDEDVILPNYRIPVRVLGDPDTVLSDYHWKAIWMGGTFAGINYDALYTDATFDDYSFNYELPYPEQDAKYILDSENLPSGQYGAAPTAQITYEYNHYLSKYQDYIKDLDSELLIPNMYLLKTYYYEYATSYARFNTHIENFITREGIIPEETAAELLVPFEEEIDTDGNLINMEDSSIYQYLTSSIVINALSASTKTAMKDILQNIIFDRDPTANIWFNESVGEPQMVPFYMKFSFEPQSQSVLERLAFTKFGAAMADADYKDRFLMTLKQVFNDEIDLSSNEHQFAVQTSYWSGSTDLSTNTWTINTQNQTYRSVDFMEMLLYGYKNYIAAEENYYYFGFDDFDKRAVMDPSGSYRYYNSINSINVINSIVDYVKDSENFEIDSIGDLYDIAERAPFGITKSYTETIAYRIEKIGGPPTDDAQTQNVLQNFWLWNADGLLVEKSFYDSQVKYNEDYTYNIYAYVIVVGYKYSFSDIVLSRQIGTTADSTGDAEDEGTYCIELYDPTTNEASPQLFSTESNLEEHNVLATNAQIISDDKYITDFYLNYEPSIKLIEIPVMSKTLRITDNPPNQINVIPYQMMDASQKIGYTLAYELFNESADYPTTITADDAKIKSDYLHAKDLISSDYLEQESVSMQQYIEVYRLDEKPTSMTDFQTSLIATIDLKDPKSSTIKSLHDFIQKVRTNKTYYYLFRMLNEQYVPGHLTEIYEAQLINDGGYTYSIFNVLFEEDLEEEIFTNPSKVFKKLFQLTPNLSQLTLNTDNVDYDQPGYTQLENIEVGESDDLIWGKQFKIRLTSKKTGKKIDLNFTYNLESD